MMEQLTIIEALLLAIGITLLLGAGVYTAIKQGLQDRLF